MSAYICLQVNMLAIKEGIFCTYRVEKLEFRIFFDRRTFLFGLDFYRWKNFEIDKTVKLKFGFKIWKKKNEIIKILTFCPCTTAKTFDVIF